MSGFTIYDEDRIPELILSKKSEEFVQDFYKQNNLTNKMVIGIHPGASNTNKQYKNYPEIVEGIKDICQNAILLVFEGPGESSIVDSVINRTKDVGIEAVRVQRPVKEYLAIISCCELMICNDSAAGHFAAAYGIPTVVIFGPVKMETAIPRGKGKIVGISKEYECKPCTLPILLAPS